MLFSLLVLATPRIGPPPNVGPLKPEPELEDDDPEGDDPGEFEFPAVSDELPEDASPEDALSELPLAEFCVLALVCCSPFGPPGAFGPGAGPKSGPLFKLMSV